MRERYQTDEQRNPKRQTLNLSTQNAPPRKAVEVQARMRAQAMVCADHIVVPPGLGAMWVLGF